MALWLAAALAQQGRLDEAREIFRRVLGVRNDVGLLAEEYDPRGHRRWATSRRRSPRSRS